MDIDNLLEREKNQHKTESWNKLHQTTKIQKLHAFSESYGKKHALSAQNVKKLKQYFSRALQDKKLNKTKDVVYDKDKQEIVDVPGLAYNNSTHSFTLRSDVKKPSALKSLTPRRTTQRTSKEEIEKNAKIENDEEKT